MKLFKIILCLSFVFSITAMAKVDPQKLAAVKTKCDVDESVHNRSHQTVEYAMGQPGYSSQTAFVRDFMRTNSSWDKARCVVCVAKLKRTKWDENLNLHCNDFR